MAKSRDSEEKELWFKKLHGFTVNIHDVADIESKEEDSQDRKSKIVLLTAISNTLVDAKNIVATQIDKIDINAGINEPKISLESKENGEKIAQIDTKGIYNAKDAIREIFGDYKKLESPLGKKDTLPGIVVVNNYFGSNNNPRNNALMVCITNTLPLSNSHHYFDYFRDFLASEPTIGKKKEEEKKKGLENATQGDASWAITSFFFKSLLGSNTQVLPTTTMLISYSQKIAQVFADTLDKKSIVIADIAKNMPEIEKIQEADQIYNIVRGDSLWKIANEYGVSLSELKAANPWLEERISKDESFTLVKPGEQLNVPGKTVEITVQEGLNISKENLENMANSSSLDIDKVTSNKEQDRSKLGNHEVDSSYFASNS